MFDPREREQAQPQNDFDQIRIGLASAEKIRSWSFGEVTKPETINYRTFKPERDGLFCTAIFGPTTDWECLCGKYKRMKHRGVICEKCGTEVTRSRVRRERMGHVELAAPCSHVWYFKVLPSQIGTLLDIKMKDLERVLYYEAYIVVDTEDPDVLKEGEVISDQRKEELDDEDFEYTALMGAEGIKELLRNLNHDLHELATRLRFQMKHGWGCKCKSDCECEYCPHPPDFGCHVQGRAEGADPCDCGRCCEQACDCPDSSKHRKKGPCSCKRCCDHETCGKCPSCHLRWRCPCKCGCYYYDSEPKKLKVARRLRIVDAFAKSPNKPEWMILDVLPVIPPELRPLVPLDGGRFATSDLNDLYRRVINRNNRLKKLLDLRAPDVIVRNEKRMLQEAVDALFDNGRRGTQLRGANRRPLKSLADSLKGKTGRFRQNLLGKRVDYSGRSVIVAGPELKLHQCGLPKKMALELFKPFIFQRLEQRGHSTTIKQAKELVNQRHPIVYDILDDVIQDHPVLLNRAPTLHRLGIQAFEPVLVEGKAIKIHPLVCTAFNADFDGDQMAVHVPLSPESQVEASVLMLSANNILSPANGSPITTPTQDMVLGVYYLTVDRPGAVGEGRTFGSVREVLLAHEHGLVETRAPIGLLYSGWVIDLTVEEGNQQIQQTQPVRYRRQHLETTVGRVVLNDCLPGKLPFINGVIKKKGLSQLVSYCYLKLGRETAVGMLDSLKDLGFEYSTRSGMSIGIDDMVVPRQKEELVDSSQQQVMEVEQQYQDGAITFGERYNKIIEIWSNLTDNVTKRMFAGMKSKENLNPIWVMSDSGARGSEAQMRQLSGMRGLMAKPSGEIIETPITANFREGLNVLQYFISTHGARKGLADTALKTANSGYLTRRLVDVAQDVIITEIDCGTGDGIEVKALVESGEIRERLQDRVVGRVAARDVREIDGTVLARAGQEITEDLAAELERAGIDRVVIRSVLTCETERGVCQLCYGRNLATGRLVERGEAVGIIAAESIGEPGTQLTMRTFHVGGTATRVGRESEQRVKSVDGFAKFIDVSAVQDQEGNLVAMNRNGFVAVEDSEGRERERYQVAYGAKLKVADGDRVVRSQVLVEWDPFTFSILTEAEGQCYFLDLAEGVTLQEQVDEVSGLSQLVVTDAPAEKKGAKKMEPRIEIRDAQGAATREYLIPTHAHLMVRDGDMVHGGEVLAKIPRETTKTKDITGGLPRVVELFEARKPKEPAVISEIDGAVEYGPLKAGYRQIMVNAETAGGILQTKMYKVRRGVHVNFQNGESIKAGEALTDGPRDPQDILRVLGEKELQQYLVNEIQAVYRVQGVGINDKHLEVIVRQMMRWVEVENVGDTEFLHREEVDKFRFQRTNREIAEAGKRPAAGRPLLRGITKAALSTDSFISAASFQLTTKVLTEASVTGKVDDLRGLKENVIVGRLIPAGTGLKGHRQVRIQGEDSPETIVPEHEYLEDLESMDLGAPMDFAAMFPQAGGGGTPFGSPVAGTLSNARQSPLGAGEVVPQTGDGGTDGPAGAPAAATPRQ